MRAVRDRSQVRFPPGLTRFEAIDLSRREEHGRHDRDGSDLLCDDLNDENIVAKAVRRRKPGVCSDAIASKPAMMGVIRQAHWVNAMCTAIARFSGVTATPANATQANSPDTPAACAQRLGLA